MATVPGRSRRKAPGKMQNQRLRQIIVWLVVIGMILATVASVATLFAS